MNRVQSVLILNDNERQIVDKSILAKNGGKWNKVVGSIYLDSMDLDIGGIKK